MRRLRLPAWRIWCQRWGIIGAVDLDYARLQAAVLEACAERGWLQTDLIERSGIGRSTVQRIYRGEQRKPSPRTRMQLEIVFGWAPGSVMAILRGGMPTPANGNPLTGSTASASPADDDNDPFIQELYRMRSVTPEGREAVIRAYRAEKAREEEQRRRDDAEREERFRQIAEAMGTDQAS